MINKIQYKTYIQNRQMSVETILNDITTNTASGLINSIRKAS